MRLIWKAGLKSYGLFKFKLPLWVDATGAFANFDAYFDGNRHHYSPRKERMIPDNLQEPDGRSSYSIDFETGEKSWDVHPFGDNYYELQFRPYVHVGQYTNQEPGIINITLGIPTPTIGAQFYVKVIKATVKVVH